MAKRSGSRIEPLTKLRWPIGPLYLDLVDTADLDASAWIAYKHRAAEWYLGALIEVCQSTRGLNRHVGLEMALDGFVTATCSAVDAATFRLVRALEGNRNQIPAPEHQCTWGRARDLMAGSVRESNGVSRVIGPPLGLPSCQAMGVASARTVIGDAGWLTVVKRIRNRMVHQDTITRRFVRSASDNLSGGPTPPTDPPQDFLTVKGGMAIEPIPFFTKVLPLSRNLTASLIADTKAL